MEITDNFFWAAAFLVCHWFMVLHDYHMFQLNSYKPKVQLRWLCSYRGYLNRFRLRKAKKPLVYTPRVKRMFFTHAVLSAAAAWLLYSHPWPPLLGALLLLTPLSVLAVNFLNAPLEWGINHWYISDAKRILAQSPNLTVIGVTGSYGKTSTKYFLQKLLSPKYNVLMTPESYNTTLGVVKTVRTQLKPIHEIFVCEMGARNVGDIKEICDIVRPRHGVITAVGPQHLESFKTVENVAKTKFELADALPEDGMLFLNYDSEPIRNKNHGRAVYYSASPETRRDYAARDARVSGSGVSFDLTLSDGRQRRFETKLIGRHNVLNLVAAIAVADRLGVEAEDIAAAVCRLESVPHRLQLIRRNNIILIDDAYNSNESGAEAALEALGMFEGFKILITPGMVELGALQDEHNRRFGERAAAVCDYVILVGGKQTRSIAGGLRDRAYPEEKIFTAGNLEQAFGAMEKIDAGGVQKVVLLENDLPDNY